MNKSKETTIRVHKDFAEPLNFLRNALNKKGLDFTNEETLIFTIAKKELGNFFLEKLKERELLVNSASAVSIEIIKEAYNEKQKEL